MTTNRWITLQVSWLFYPAFKLTFLTSFLCYNKVTAARLLKTPHRPSRANVLTADTTELAPDLQYLSALIEPDTVVNLRYGILFLLALSSLSVYSIILAG